MPFFKDTVPLFFMMIVTDPNTLCRCVVACCLLLLQHSSLVMAFTFVPTSINPALKVVVGQRRIVTYHRMVRNIDFPEALVFFDIADDDNASVLVEDDDKTLRPGLLDLLQECQDVSTPALYITSHNQQDLENNISAFSEIKSYLKVFHHHQQETSSSKTTQSNQIAKSIWDTIHSIIIQPEGFGGSSGFGRKMADPERSPLPQYVVVFTTSIEICRAARAIGMRVLCLQDNDLADAIIDDYYNLYLEDIATPGSFWLNPPHPRDDDGNRVDVSTLLAMAEEEENDDTQEEENQNNNNDEEFSDDALQSILNDLDPL